MHKDEAPVLQEYALPLAQQALDTLSQALPVHAAGARSSSRCSRSTTTSPSATSACPGMIGALGACFGRVVTMDSPRARPPGEFQWEATLWHELAHVITLQMSNQRVPRWLTEGISVYEEKLARPEWGRGMDMAFAQHAEPRRDAEAARSERRVHRTRRRSRSPTSRRRCSSSTSSTRSATPGCSKLLRAYGQGLDTDAALKAALEHRLRRAAGELRPGASSSGSATLRAALRASDEDDDLLEDAARRAAAVRGRSNPGSYPVQMVLGDALREGRRARRGDAGVRARRGAGADGDRRRQPARADRRRSRSRRRTRPRAIAALQALVAVGLRQRRGGAAARRRCCARANVTDPAQLRPVYQRIAAIDPFDAEAHAMLGRLALQRDDADDGDPRVPRGRRARSRSIRPRRYTDLAESYFKGGQRAEARKQTLAALEIAPELRARAGPAAEAVGGASEPRPLERAASGGPLGRPSLAGRRCWRCVPALAAAASTRSCPTRADDRFAGLQWRFVRIKYHYITEGTRDPQDFYGEPWVIDGPAAEQNLSRRLQDRDRDPGRRSDRPDARRSAALRLSRGSTSSSPAT